MDVFFFQFKIVFVRKIIGNNTLQIMHVTHFGHNKQGYVIFLKCMIYHNT